MRPATRRSLGVVLCTVSLGSAAAGCGSEAPDERYAAGWDAVCGDVRRSLQQFRTELVTAARAAPDAGDDAAQQPLGATAAAAVLDRPARKLERSLRAPLRAARALDPPEQWRSWHAGAVERFATQVDVVTAGVRRVSAGDAEALSALAIGGFGPASVTAPQALRDQTPTCVQLR